MRITETGKYIALEDIHVHQSYSRYTVKAGSLVRITQIDKEGHQVIGPELGEWCFWELPLDTLEDGFTS